MNVAPTPTRSAADAAVIAEAVRGLSPVVRSSVRRSAEAYATVKSVMGLEDNNSRVVAEVLVDVVRLNLDFPDVEMTDSLLMLRVGAECRAIDRGL